ncbi:MAG: hypothetical protein QXM58_02170 [Candidatus Micrarchaeaceae archaeon]
MTILQVVEERFTLLHEIKLFIVKNDVTPIKRSIDMEIRLLNNNLSSSASLFNLNVPFIKQVAENDIIPDIIRYVDTFFGKHI